MKLSDLFKLLRKEKSIKVFKKLTKDEIAIYNKLLKKTGSSINIDLNEDCSFNFKKEDLLQLIIYYLNNDLNEIEVNYIADALTLADSVSFGDEHLFEILEEMTDPEINGNLTKERVYNYVEFLKK